ncbi:hypothetical protein EVAR_586_1 [Eumeta japonica]|uniref:Uncharacterized protein n=1 Tax=Eumeta variegata TaxID=151549 RepID=A0A4C1SBB9_EUMVA|nr:hypothetical protein EVAR_586_1 [Eumeta japonica]
MSLHPVGLLFEPESILVSEFTSYGAPPRARIYSVNAGAARAALPVPTGWVRPTESAQEGAAPRGQFIPVSGLDFLIGVDVLLLHQTVDSVGSRGGYPDLPTPFPRSGAAL